MKWATAWVLLRYRPLRRLNDNFHIDPGAYAPGFMLTPASQAKKNSELLKCQLEETEARRTVLFRRASG